jgi:uncharacterized sulfatase
MDERPDLVRSVTDGQYVYLRNYYPHVSQGQHVSYQFETPTTRVWRRMYDEGKTTPAQSVFWQVPKAPEELYDLKSDPDEVRNLAGSPEHRETLGRMRKAQQDHAARIRDVDLLPEAELHSRAAGRSPYDMAREPGKYPFERVFDTAELASRLDDDSALPTLLQRLNDTDSAVRWWAAMGFLMRNKPKILPAPQSLLALLDDSSPLVRIVAAQTLVRHGDESSRARALGTLGKLAPPESNGVLVSMQALVAIDALGTGATPLADIIRPLNSDGPSPDERYDSYIPRLLGDIRERLNIEPSARPAKKAKAKGKKAKA